MHEPLLTPCGKNKNYQHSKLSKSDMQLHDSKSDMQAAYFTKLYVCKYI